MPRDRQPDDRRRFGPPRSGSPPLHTMSSRPEASERMGIGVAIAVGAGLGLALGILVGVTTDLPLAPEAGLTLGALLGWLSHRRRP